MHERSVKLEQLPDGVECPPALNDRFRYDANKKRLVFRGFMTKADYDRLAQLDDDYHYQRALEDLFVAAGYDEPRFGWPKILIGIAVATCLVAMSLCIWIWRH